MFVCFCSFFLDCLLFRGCLVVEPPRAPQKQALMNMDTDRAGSSNPETRDGVRKRHPETTFSSERHLREEIVTMFHIILLDHGGE
ncbi:hypothetical protein DFJ73DRAFT_886692 [Zopfochytrium polystomum]|nr:hypothetical protein DFJ73DRAFT_886692 [Zopfochytrium polystomum]